MTAYQSKDLSELSNNFLNDEVKADRISASGGFERDTEGVVITSTEVSRNVYLRPRE